jgi:alcohol dehydrogenase
VKVLDWRVVGGMMLVVDDHPSDQHPGVGLQQDGRGDAVGVEEDALVCAVVDGDAGTQVAHRGSGRQHPRARPPATLHLEALDQERHDQHRSVGTSSNPALMQLLRTGQVDAGRFVTHRFEMDEFDEAYRVFADAATTRALKVVLTRS